MSHKLYDSCEAITEREKQSEEHSLLHSMAIVLLSSFDDEAKSMR